MHPHRCKRVLCWVCVKHKCWLSCFHGSLQILVETWRMFSSFVLSSLNAVGPHCVSDGMRISINPHIICHEVVTHMFVQSTFDGLNADYVPCVAAVTNLPSLPLVTSSVSRYKQFPMLYELNHSYKHCNTQKITAHKNVSLSGSHAPHVITGCYTIKPHCAMSLLYLVAICTKQILHLLCHTLDSLH